MHKQPPSVRSIPTATSSRRILGSGSRSFGIAVFASLFLVFSQAIAEAADRSGLFHSEKEVQTWRQRAQHGPYKSTGDAGTNTPNDWERIVSNKNKFTNSPSQHRVQTLSMSYGNLNFAAAVPLRDAAFFSLVMNDSNVGNLVKRELVWQASQFSPRWGVTDSGSWIVAQWLVRLTLAYDYTKEHFSAHERQVVEQWLRGMAHESAKQVNAELSKNFPNRLKRDYSVRQQAASNRDWNGADRHAYVDRNGKPHNYINNLTKWYNNRRSENVAAFGLIGVLVNDASLIDQAKLFIEEWIKFSMFPDGTTGEYERNGDWENVQAGRTYNATNIQAAVMIAEALSRRGDDSLYRFSTSDGLWDTAGGPKSIKTAVVSFLDELDYTVQRFADDTRSGLRLTAVENRIDAISDWGREKGTQWVGEVWFAPMGNRYWQDNRIKAGYLRTTPNSPKYGTRIGSSGGAGPGWTGAGGMFPGLLFMFSDMEQIAPSSGGSQPAPAPRPEPEPAPAPQPEPEPAPAPAPETHVNVAKQATVIASSGNDGHGPERVLDGDLKEESRWSVGGLPAAQFMEIDLGSAQAIDRTELVAYMDRAYGFTVEGKANASDGYTMLVDRRNNTQPATAASPVVNTFEPVTARFLKLTITGAHGYTGEWASILEFRAFADGSGSVSKPNPSPNPEGNLTMGSAVFARFEGIMGKTLNDLYQAPKFPASPDSVKEHGSFEFGEIGDNIGVHAWAWIVPETTGDYTFWLASDDEGVLSLSPDARSEAAQPIAHVATHTANRGYDRFPSQKSAKVRLEAGKPYYIEALMKNGWGGVNLSVAWEGPGFGRQIIPGRVLGQMEDGAPEAPKGGENAGEGYVLDRSLNLAFYSNVHGNGVNNLYRHANFPNAPDSVSTLTAFDHPGFRVNNYGAYAWGWLVPATSGDYTFWLASDDQGELLLSSSANDGDASVIASVNNATARNGFDRDGSQKSKTIRLEAGKPYYIAAAMIQGGGGDHLSVAWSGPGFDRQVIPGDVLTSELQAGATTQYLTGALGVARYDNLAGTGLQTLLNAPRFPESPDSVETLDKFDYRPSGNNFGAYAWAWLIPEVSGKYRFWLACDDEGELRLSPNAEWQDAKVIASVTGWTSPHQFDKMASQRSVEIQLEAGVPYYIEGLFKQGGGGVHLTVAWEGPGIARQVIPGSVLALPAENPEAPAAGR